MVLGGYRSNLLFVRRGIPWRMARIIIDDQIMVLPNISKKCNLIIL